MNTPLNDLATFFAYSLLMEQESAERLRELADVMAHHHRSELQEILLELAAYSDKHAGEVGEVSGNLPLPELKPWDFDWPGVEPPETFDYAALRYEMSPVNCWKLPWNWKTTAPLFTPTLHDTAKMRKSASSQMPLPAKNKAMRMPSMPGWNACHRTLSRQRI